jgi:hypothetical protein
MCLRRPLRSDQERQRRGEFHIPHALRIDACAPLPLSGAPQRRPGGLAARPPRRLARRGARP